MKHGTINVKLPVLLNLRSFVGISEEYTKITTPRQDVLFKKGYLGRKRPTAAPTADSTANVNSSNSGINPDNMAADIANGNYSVNGTVEQIEGKVKVSTLEKRKIISCLCRESDSDTPTGQWRTERVGEFWGFQPPPPKFRSFDKVEPDCKLSGKYLVFLCQHPN